MTNPAGKVFLVGSGPGNAAYLTIEAQQILTTAEVLLYDALIDRELLDFVPANCLKIDVGKRGGQPSMKQSAINELLVQHCRAGKRVVRLKSGDPYIFGRGQSEVQALKAASCDFAVMPGLSSALVAPLLAGIPLTDPVLSRSFTVLSAHDPEAIDWQTLARIETLVILMGGQTLPEIVRQLQRQGLTPRTPIAIIRWASRPDQQIWSGTLADILKKTAGENLSPCVIVIGEVVRLRSFLQPPPPTPQRSPAPIPEFTPAPTVEPVEPVVELTAEPVVDSTVKPIEPIFEPTVAPIESVVELSIEPTETIEPTVTTPAAPTPDSAPSPAASLAGKTILVTRSATQSPQFSDRLRFEGATVIEMPALEIVPPSSWDGLDDAIARLSEFDWLILTSGNSVDYFFDRLATQLTGIRALSGIKIAVVGEKTAQKLRERGMQPDFVPPEFVADSLATRFPGPLEGTKLLFPRVESGGRDVLVKELTARGADVTEVAAYQSRCPETVDPDALAALQTRSVDVITFASAKTVKHFCQLLERSQQDNSWQAWLEDVCIAAIGPQTSKACESLLGRTDTEAQEYTIEGLVRVIKAWFERRKIV